MLLILELSLVPTRLHNETIKFRHVGLLVVELLVRAVNDEANRKRGKDGEESGY